MTLREIRIMFGGKARQKTDHANWSRVALQSDDAHMDPPNAHRDEIVHMDRKGRIHPIPNERQHHFVHQHHALGKWKTFTAADGRHLQLPIGKRIVVEYPKNSPLICNGGHVVRAEGHLDPQENAPTLRVGRLTYTGRGNVHEFKPNEHASFLIGIINGIKILFDDGNK